jgi:hypothetical protein
VLRNSSGTLAAAENALQQVETGEREVKLIRDELFSILLANAVTAKR